MRVMEGDPFAVTQFHCQQLKCTRDKVRTETGEAVGRAGPELDDKQQRYKL